MPHRIYLSVLGVAGLLIVLALLAFGRDVDRHCRTGRKLKQRLISAGMALALAIGFGPTLFGVVSGCKGSTGGDATDQGNAAGQRNATAAPAPRRVAPKAPPVSQDPLARIHRTIARAEEVATGRKGIHPFSQAEKAQLTALLSAADQKLAALQRAGRLGALEAELLGAELKLLTRRIKMFRSTDLKMMSCYIAMPPVDRSRSSLAMVSSRLVLLEKMTAAGRLQSKVLKRLLTRIDAELTGLESPKLLAKLPPVQRARAQKLVAQSRALVQKLRAPQPSPP